MAKYPRALPRRERSTRSPSAPARAILARLRSPLALYLQDDYKSAHAATHLQSGIAVGTLNIRLLVPQTNNRTMLLLKQLNDPRAKAIAGDASGARPDDAKLARVPAASRVRVRSEGRWQDGYPWRLRHLLRSAISEPDVVLYSAVHPTIYQTVARICE